LFIRLFNIALITAYFFCGYAQITESRYIYTLKDIVFTQSKNNTPTRTHYFSATLLKHTHNFNQIEVGDHTKAIWINVKFNRLLISLYCVPSENDLLKIPLGSPQNKAPPIS
jgi:hypothetical protein